MTGKKKVAPEEKRREVDTKQAVRVTFGGLFEAVGEEKAKVVTDLKDRKMDMMRGLES